VTTRTYNPFLTPWAIYAALVFGFVLIMPTGMASQLDFHCFYAAGTLMRTNPAELYDPLLQMRLQVASGQGAGTWAPFLQPPYEALFLAPFTLLPYRSAYLLYLLLNLLLLIPCFLLARDAFSNIVHPWQPRAGLMFFISMPLEVALVNGQPSIRMLLICCAVWHQISKNKDLSAGLILSLGLFKLQIALPLALLLALWRGTQFLAGFVVGIGGLTLASTCLVGLNGMRGFISALITKSDNNSLAMPNLFGLLSATLGGRMSHSTLMVTTVTASIAIILLAAWYMRASDTDGERLAVAVIVAVAVSYHLHLYDCTVLLIAVGLLCQRSDWVSKCSIALFFVAPAILPLNLRFLYVLPLLALAFQKLPLMLAEHRSAELREAGS
jgi:hypothetical protein